MNWTGGEPAFLAALFALAVVSGGTAAVAGFGIGSLLTPLLATQLGTPTAVAAVAIPHAAATALRCWRLRAHIDGTVLRGFGLLSAAGGLIGALLYSRISSSALTTTLGLLLVATAIATITEWASRWSPRGWLVGALGFLSGGFGGLAGNQGGLRSAALLSFSLTPLAFVATATATGLLVDIARTPVYLWQAGPELRVLGIPLSIATAGVLIGTLLGERILLGMPARAFRKAVAGLIGLLGIWILVRAA